MKLIIDIPDNEYHQICELRLHNRTFYDDAIRNGTPLDKVVEDIKREIEHTHYHYVGVPILKVSEVLNIIDKHISGKEQE